MDPLSITASVFAFIQTSDRVAGVCKYYIDTIKGYPRELRVIFIETKSVAVVCEGLQFLRQDDVDDAAIIARLAGSDGPIEECKKTVEQLESLLPSPNLPPNSTPEAGFLNCPETFGTTPNTTSAKASKGSSDWLMTR
ncbi:hypothetical protein EDB80DRAFT_680861 [Ilyonectria destructans]|nr:hypothetical protein EDB80DRAFT_680861 [Ilyonectria destructans]